MVTRISFEVGVQELAVVKIEMLAEIEIDAAVEKVETNEVRSEEVPKLS
jgi:hypothetical protein